MWGSKFYEEGCFTIKEIAQTPVLGLWLATISFIFQKEKGGWLPNWKTEIQLVSVLIIQKDIKFAPARRRHGSSSLKTVHDFSPIRVDDEPNSGFLNAPWSFLISNVSCYLTLEQIMEQYQKIAVTRFARPRFSPNYTFSVAAKPT